MKKGKIFFTFILILTLNFISTNKSQASINASIKNNYPDVSYEFVGNDKFENFNRKIFLFNLKANKYIVRPINIVWASVMPQYGMDRVQNFYTNVRYPVRLVSTLIQKDFESSKSETKRFFINTTIGIGGLYDVAQAKHKIEPHQEDMGQALAYRNIKKGPYLVLPVVSQGNIRDIAGQALDLPLSPTSYIVGPISLASTGLSLVNSTTYMQPVFKMADTYADPYEVSKQLYGIEKYIRITNLDRREVFKEKSASVNENKNENEIKISEVKSQKINIEPDVKLSNYTPQSPQIDSLRTMLFDSQKLNNSAWSELSIWNKSFSKKIKTASVNVNYNRKNYKYRYILQKKSMSPLAILYPSIGEGAMSNQSTVFAKILYDRGYSVVILGSPFQWEFVKSMPENYRPGFPPEDARQLRNLTSKVLTDLQVKKSCIFGPKILVGTSFGGLTSLFVADQEKSNNTLNISKYIAINPPIEIFYAMQQIDKYSNVLQNGGEDLKLKAAITAQKVIAVAQTDYKIDSPDSKVTLPFTEEEARLAISYAMKMKLSNLVFTLENGSTSKKSDIYKTINNMSFNDYADKYILENQGKSFDKLSYEASLYSISDYLRTNDNYKIFHTLDDCFTNPQQLSWLKNQTRNQSTIFSNGSHLGVLYRKEFINQFIDEIKNFQTLPQKI